MWRVGIDVGGTFTDLFAWNEADGRQVSSKVLTTRPDRSQGVISALRAAGIASREISYLMHGTTTATNALLERNYPDPAMITTEGFRDTIEIGRQHREFLYDPYQVKPRPIIKRRYRYTLNERMDAQGPAAAGAQALAWPRATAIKCPGQARAKGAAFLGAAECLLAQAFCQQCPAQQACMHDTVLL